MKPWGEWAAAAAVVLIGWWLRPRLGGARGDGRVGACRVGASSGTGFDVGRRRHPRRPSRAEIYAGLLDTAAAEVRTGASLAGALAVASERWPHALTLPGIAGEDHSAGTRAGPPSRPSDESDAAVVLQVVGATAALGGPVAASLDTGAALLRERMAARAEAMAHSAQARLSARVLTAVPLVFAGWSAVGSTSFRDALLSPAGVVAAIAGALLNLGGWWWMRRIVGRVAA